MNDKILFDIFTKNNGDKFALYNEIKDLIQSEIINARGVENAKFYETLIRLSNSENNAGWEDRHSNRIKIINDKMSAIADDYDSFLP
jgi:antibiotic biosynthesis monooxygenase (ABM) superfamily enzyme